jgi:uncharacterized LabA/DUF88 family protein
MVDQKAYKEGKIGKDIMLPGNPKGLPDESFFEDTLVFFDAGFFSKLKKRFGGDKYLDVDFCEYSKLIASMEKCNLKKIFYYTAPPFQSDRPTKEEEIRRERFDHFKQKLVEKGIVFREGRCQRLKIDGNFCYSQKAVDILLVIDLTSVPLKYPNVKKVILIACDSDFVPVINFLQEQGVRVILYTYYEKKRNTIFSRSNHLIKSVYKYKLISKEDLEECSIKEVKK